MMLARRRGEQVPLGDNRGGAESEPGQTVATPNNDTGTLSVVTHFIMSACNPTVHWLNVVTAISCIYQTLVFVLGQEHGRRGSHSHRLYKHLWEGNPWCPRGTLANIWAAPCSVSLDTFIITWLHDRGLVMDQLFIFRLSLLPLRTYARAAQCCYHLGCH